MNRDLEAVDRQREHQANERTFLAWLRTSIALIGFGFAIARFGLFLRQLEAAVTGADAGNPSLLNSQTLGVGLVMAGILLIPLSAWRYNRVFWQIERGNYQPNRLIVWITAAVVMLLGFLSIPFVLWRHSPLPKASSHRTLQKYESQSLKQYKLKRLPTINLSQGR
ncbi:MAG: YidH family protein [Actinomycetota bacterium]